MTEKRPTLSINRKPKNPVSQGVPKANAEAMGKPSTALTPPKTPKGTPEAKKTLTEAPTSSEQPKLTKAERIARDRANKIRRGEAALPLLVQLWPEVFSLTAPKPLKVGIKEDVVADARARDLDISRNQIVAALMVYTNRPEYRSSVAQGGQRVDLHGLADGEVDEKSIEHARRKLEKINTKSENTNEN